MPLATRRNILFVVLSVLGASVAASATPSVASATALAALPVAARTASPAPSAPASASVPDPAPCAAVDANVEKAAILKVITDMQAAWNRGDFRGYMEEIGRASCGKEC